MLESTLAALNAVEPNVPALLTAWRISRSGALGALLVELEVAVRRPSLRAPTVGATVVRFDDAAALSVGDERLQWVALVPVGKVSDATRQLAVLRGFEPDPRIAAHLLGLFQAPPFRSRPTLGWWTTILELIEHSADARTADQLEVLIPQLAVAFSQPMAVKLTEAVEELRRRLPTVQLDAEELVQAAAAARRRWLPAPGVDTDALLALVYASPFDADRLQVFADAALSVGDPRGEAIALSLMEERGTKLSSSHKARGKALEKLHRDDWLGPLARVLIASTIKLRHTFLHEAVVKPKHQEEVEAVIGDPRWSRVQRLEIRAVADYHDANASGAWRAVERLVAHPVLHGLRSLTGDLSPEFVAGLCEGTVRPLEVLQRNWYVDSEELGFDALSATDRLPKLRHFISRSYRQRHAEDWRWLLDGALFRQLHHLELGIGFDGIGAWWTWFQSETLPVLEVTDRWGHTRVRFVRGAGGVSMEATQRYGSSLIETVQWLEALEDDAIEQLTMKWRVGANSQPPEKLEERLRVTAPRVARRANLPKLA